MQDSYNLGWKIAAVLGGAPEALLASYEEERRPIASAMLGLSTKLLDELKKPGGMRRGRETAATGLRLLGVTAFSGEAAPNLGVRAGDRAPDAPIRGAAGVRTRLFKLFQGPHWTLLGYEVDRTTAVQVRVRAAHPHARSAWRYRRRRWTCS